jgi:hypothetical protein
VVAVDILEVAVLEGIEPLLEHQEEALLLRHN